MTNLDLAEAVKRETVYVRKFKFVPATKPPCEVELFEDGSVTGDLEELTSWEVVYTKPQNLIALRLRKGSELKSVMSLTPQGQWKGRDRRSNGVMLLTPITLETGRWRLFSNPIAYAKTLQVASVPEVQPLDGFGYQEMLPPQLDWKPFEYDLSKLVHTDKLIQSKVGVALVACDRPTYFERMVTSLAQNAMIHKLPVFLFLDQAEKDHDADKWQAQVEATHRHLPHAVIIKRPRNFGCGRNIVDARIQLFENMGYEKVFVFEDDMVLSSDYVQMCLNMMDWADENFSNVGAVQAWNKCIMSLDAKRQRHGEVQATYTNWWGYLMKKEAWDAMAPEMKAWQQAFLGGDYGKRPHKTIWRYFKEKRTAAPAIVGDHRFRMDEESWNTHRRYFDAPPTGQDAATMTFFEQSGYVRLTTTVNRGLYIGQYGIHMNPRMFQRDGLHMIDLVPLEGDSNRLEFWKRGDRDFQPSGIESPLPNMEHIRNV